jgi:hypothetical protein
VLTILIVFVEEHVMVMMPIRRYPLERRNDLLRGRGVREAVRVVLPVQARQAQGGGAYKLNSVYTHSLISARFQPLSL